MRVARWSWIVGIAAVDGLVVAAVLLVVQPLPRSKGTGCFDRAAFDQVVARLPPPPTNQDAFDRVDAPDKIGSCRINESVGVQDGYIFYSDSMGFDDSGWGYFPTGPNDDLGNGSWESPQFKQIDGPWYTWTASW
ncbi:hypothetical protein ABT369_37585 [Dactylosporangium sp. NPDC000244]|uniref:hypothetical protein n=1 Tax=Dactylosporangium sp. NPDC000244 TaxID=3154365 RepID=UPI003321CBAA